MTVICAYPHNLCSANSGLRSAKQNQRVVMIARHDCSSTIVCKQQKSGTKPSTQAPLLAAASIPSTRLPSPTCRVAATKFVEELVSSPGCGNSNIWGTRLSQRLAAGKASQTLFDGLFRPVATVHKRIAKEIARLHLRHGMVAGHVIPAAIGIRCATAMVLLLAF